MFSEYYIVMQYMLSEYKTSINLHDSVRDPGVQWWTYSLSADTQSSQKAKIKK